MSSFQYVILGLYRGYIGIMEKKMETTIVYCGYNGIMEKKMETTIVYWGYIGIMKKKMETTTMENQMEKNMENEMETGIIIRVVFNSLVLSREWEIGA